MDETGWLVERTDTGTPLYWSGDGWTTDSLAAARFTRAHDAQRIAARLPEPCEAREHMWCAPPVQPTPRDAGGNELSIEESCRGIRSALDRCDTLARQLVAQIRRMPMAGVDFDRHEELENAELAKQQIQYAQMRLSMAANAARGIEPALEAS